ncbi:MAG: 30S ribosomal protein S18 [Clostridia bacterium]|nr:30S ribosomal protein S18 [Clostridia bacterium]MDD4408549.1 30S ribosomal protein S18 [Clostridia bacterium]
MKGEQKGEPREGFKRFKKMGKKRVCNFCVEKAKSIDYKDTAKLKHYVTEKGKILPRRQTGTCSKHQRALAMAIKRARIMALLPFKAD